MYELQDGSWVKIANDIAGKPDSGEIYADFEPKFHVRMDMHSTAKIVLQFKETHLEVGVEVLELKDNEWVQENQCGTDGDEDVY